MTEARIPITSASSSTDISTWRRVAPSVRSVASSRVRCAIVIESVFAITNVPTNSAIAAEREQEVVDDREEAVRVLGGLLRPARPPSAPACRRQDRLDLGSRAAAGSCRFAAAMLIESSFPSLWKSLLRGREVEDRDRRAAERRDAADLDDAGDLVRRYRAVRDHADRLADLEVLLAARCARRSRPRGRRRATSRRRA